MGRTTTPRGGGIRPEAQDRAHLHAIDDHSLPAASPRVDGDLAEALAAAVARWGDRAVVHESITPDAEGRSCLTRHVGRQHDAFANADGHEGAVPR